MPVLAYHLVTDRVDWGVAWVTRQQFAGQMRWLSDHGFSTVRLSELFEPTIRTVRHPVVITFDDAYSCLQDAAAIMAEYGFIGTCFAISDFVGCQNDWDYQFFGRRWRHADVNLLRDLIAAGWEVGSHSRRHRNLVGLSKSEMEQELRGSRLALEDMLGVAVKAISYPFGRASTAVCRTASRVGYCVGVTLGHSPAAAAQFGRMGVPRVGVYLFDGVRGLAWKVRAVTRASHAPLYVQQAISAFSTGTVIWKRFF